MRLKVEKFTRENIRDGLQYRDIQDAWDKRVKLLVYDVVSREQHFEKAGLTLVQNNFWR